MCNAAIYAANTNVQELAVGDVVNFGQIVRRFGPNLMLSGGNVVIEGKGYYDVDVNINLEGTVAGDVTLSLYRDGVRVPGATATVTTAVGSMYSVTIPCIVRETCCCESEITVVISENAATVNSASILVEKI